MTSSTATPAASAHAATGAGERERAELLEVVAVRRRGRIRRAGLEEPRRDAHREIEVAAGPGEDRPVREPLAPVPHRVDEDDPRPLPLRLAQDGQQVDVRDRDVLSPEEDVPRVQEVEDVVRLLVAEVGLLRRVARAGADVAALDRHGAEQLEEVVHDGLHEAEGAARAVVEDRGRARTPSGSRAGGRRRSRAPRPRSRARGRRSLLRSGVVSRSGPFCISGNRAVRLQRKPFVTGWRVAPERDEPAVLDGRDRGRTRRGSRGCRRCEAWRRPWRHCRETASRPGLRTRPRPGAGGPESASTRRRRPAGRRRSAACR